MSVDSFSALQLMSDGQAPFVFEVQGSRVAKTLAEEARRRTKAERIVTDQSDELG